MPILCLIFVLGVPDHCNRVDCSKRDEHSLCPVTCSKNGKGNASRVELHIKTRLIDYIKDSKLCVIHIVGLNVICCVILDLENDRVSEDDIERAVRKSLKDEVARKPKLSTEKIRTLYHWISALMKYLPLRKIIYNFLDELRLEIYHVISIFKEILLKVLALQILQF